VLVVEEVVVLDVVLDVVVLVCEVVVRVVVFVLNVVVVVCHASRRAGKGCEVVAKEAGE